MPDYTTNDPRGWCGDPSRGAALGRPTIKDAGRDFTGRIYVRRVRLDSGAEVDRQGILPRPGSLSASGFRDDA